MPNRAWNVLGQQTTVSVAVVRVPLIRGMLLSAESACISKPVSAETIVVSVKPGCVNGTFHFPVTSHIAICPYKWLIYYRHASRIFVLFIVSRSPQTSNHIYDFFLLCVCHNVLFLGHLVG